MEKRRSFLYFKRIFLKLLAFVYLSAFTSIFIQIPALFSRDGLAPINVYFTKISENFGGLGFFPFSVFRFTHEINSILVTFLPFLQFFDAYDNVMHFSCLLGIFISLAILWEKETHYFNNMVSFSVLWFLYFSIFVAGQMFLAFQWDIMLLEVGFLAIFFQSNFNDDYEDEINEIARYLLKWLAFRLYFSSGLLKLLSNCTTWWNLTALFHHFQTQCIPHSLSWVAHNYIPDWIKRFMVAGNFFIMIFTPMLFFFPYKPLKCMGGIYQILMQIRIMLTGNYNFYNLLSIIITLSLFDDQFLRKLCPNWFKHIFSIPLETKQAVAEKRNDKQSQSKHFTRFFFTNLSLQIMLITTVFGLYFPYRTWLYGEKLPFQLPDVKFVAQYGCLLGAGFFIIDFLSHFVYALFIKSNDLLKMEKKVLRIAKGFYGIVFFIFIFFSSFYIFSASLEVDITRFMPEKTSFLLKRTFDISNKYHIVNPHGLFRKMTGIFGRPELIIEGSLDGYDWQAYEFYYKPGKIDEKPKFTLVHQPRLDWQMWSAALGDNISNEIWLIHLLKKLFKNSPNILTLIKTNPFPVSGPNYLRIQKYKYWFTNITESKFQGAWWKRKFDSVYLGVLHKNDESLTNYLRNFGFENLDYVYPVHILQKIPVVEIILSFFLIVSCVNLLNSESKE